MVALVLRFVSSARAAGLRVSTSEVLDCLSHLERVDLLDESQFKSVLQTNFAKSRREQVHFERLYQLFFHERRQHPSIARSVALADQIQAVLQALAPPAGSDLLLQALLDFLGGQPRRTPRAAFRRPANGRAATAGLRPRGAVLLPGRIDALEESLAAAVAGRRAELGWEERRDLLEHFQDRLDSARRLLEQPPRTSRGHGPAGAVLPPAPRRFGRNPFCLPDPARSGGHAGGHRTTGAPAEGQGQPAPCRRAPGDPGCEKNPAPRRRLRGGAF